MTIIGTMQVCYTDFHYLRQSWKTTTEKEALVGGLDDKYRKQCPKDLNWRASDLAEIVNKTYADMF